VIFKKQRASSRPSLICPACGTSVNTTAYIYKNGSNISDFYSCQNCSFLFARPVFIPELDGRQMDGVDNAELFNSRFLKWVYIKYFIKREIRALRRVKGVGRLRLLDVGCGTGWTTKVFSENDFEVLGIEPSQVRANYAREHYGIDVVCNYIEHVEFDDKFDVVVLRHIVEHFADPGLVLQKVRHFLKEGGVVFVIVPNINCLGRYLFETKWAWVLPWHCNFFSPKSLHAFLRREQFDVLKCYQTPTPLYYPGAIMRSFPNRAIKWLFGKNRIFSMLMCSPLAVFGKLIGLGDNLNFVAKVK